MLQGGLQHHGRGRSRQLRHAVEVGSGAAHDEVVVLVGLAQREISQGVAARIADHVGLVGGDQRGRHPGLDGVLAGGLDQVVNLLAGRGRCLRLAAGTHGDAPAARPGHAARQSQIRGGIDTAGVVCGETGAGLELVLGDDIGIVAIGAAGDRALRQASGTGSTTKEGSTAVAGTMPANACIAASISAALLFDGRDGAGQR